MFRSKIRSVIIPQYEHGRLAGTFASLWGNRDFKRSVINFFVQGVMPVIRSAQVEDALAIAHIHGDTWRTTYGVIVPSEHWVNAPPLASVIWSNNKR